MTALWWAAWHDVTLADALSRGPGVGSVALLASPDAYTVGVVDEQGCATPAGAVDVTAVFEARSFGPTAELRWLQTAPGRSGEPPTGSAVLLAEDGAGGGLGVEPTSVAVHSVIDGAYLLWGKATGGAEASGWSELAAYRVGTLTVPCEGVPAGGRVELCVREYAAVVDDHGNVAIIEERLLGLRVAGRGKA